MKISGKFFYIALGMALLIAAKAIFKILPLEYRAKLGDGNAQYKFALYNFEEGKFEESSEWALKALSSKRSAEELTNLASMLQYKAPEEAEDLFELAAQKGSAEAYIELSGYAVEETDYLKHLKQAAKMQNYFPAAAYALQIDNHSTVGFLTFLAEELNDADAQMALADLYIEKGEQERAIALLKQATTKDEGFISYLSLAELYYTSGNNAEALKWLEALFTRHPNLTAPFIRRSFLKEQHLKIHELMDFYEKS